MLDGLKTKKSTDELENELDSLKVESEVASKRSEIAEKEAVVKQLKREYGKNWAQTLGISKLMDVQTLRSFLRGANKGMHHQAGQSAVKQDTGDSLARLRVGFGNDLGGVHKA